MELEEVAELPVWISPYSASLKFSREKWNRPPGIRLGALRCWVACVMLGHLYDPPKPSLLLPEKE